MSSVLIREESGRKFVDPFSLGIYGVALSHVVEHNFCPQKHPLAIRWFHWINFPVIFIMIWSGLLIYWANDVYRIGWGDRGSTPWMTVKEQRDLARPRRSSTSTTRLEITCFVRGDPSYRRTPS